VVKALEKICDVADKCNVDLAMEPIAGTLVHDFYSFQELFSRFDHPRLGVTMDPSHFLLHRNDFMKACLLVLGIITLKPEKFLAAFSAERRHAYGDYSIGCS